MQCPVQYNKYEYIFAVLINYMTKQNYSKTKTSKAKPTVTGIDQCKIKSTNKSETKRWSSTKSQSKDRSEQSPNVVRTSKPKVSNHIQTMLEPQRSKASYTEAVLRNDLERFGFFLVLSPGLKIAAQFRNRTIVQ